MNIIKVVLQITAIAFSPQHREIILEYNSKYLFHYNLEYLKQVSEITDQVRGSTNSILPFKKIVAPYWQIQPVKPAIIETKPDKIEVWSIDKSILATFENPQIEDSFSISHLKRQLFYKTYSNNAIDYFLCLTSRPRNPDFEETGIALYCVKDKKYRISKRVKTAELDIHAAWNNEIQSFVLAANSEQKFYYWPLVEEDAIEIPYTTVYNNSSLTCKIDANGKTLYLIEDQESKNQILLKIGTLSGSGISWKIPLPITRQSYLWIGTNPSGDKFSLLSQSEDAYQLSIYDSSGTIRQRHRIENKQYDAGIGWVTDSILICAGHKELLLIKADGLTQSPSPGILKHKKGNAKNL
jgi:hypothetical protein